MDLVTRKYLNEEKLKKKALRLKLSDICHTRAKKSSPNTFNLYVILAGHHIAGLPRAGKNSKPLHYKQKIQKMKGLARKAFTEKTD